MAQNLRIHEGTPAYGQGSFYATEPTDKAFSAVPAAALVATAAGWEMPVGTIEFWVNFTSLSGYTAVCGLPDSPTTASIQTSGTSLLLMWHVGGTGGGTYDMGTGLTTGTWYYVALQWDGTTFEWWLTRPNGSHIGHGTKSFTGQNPFAADGYTGDIGVVGWPVTGNNVSDRVDGFRVSNVLRYTNTNPLPVPTATPTTDANTVDLYLFQDTIATEVRIVARKVRLATESSVMLLRTWRNRQFNVLDSQFGAVGDGVTDDTAAIQAAINAAFAAGGGRIVFPITGSPYLVAGPALYPGGANAQIVLPNVEYSATPEKQVVLTLEGELPAPICYSVIGAAPAADQHTVIKSTLTGAGQVFGAYGSVTSYGHFTNLLVSVLNLTVRMPPNPAGSALNLKYVAQVRIDGVSVDTGDYSVSTLTEPTHTAASALVLPGGGNGAFTYVGSFGAIGMYNCVAVGEHADIQEITSYGCKIGVLNDTGGHTRHIKRLNVHHQPYGVKASWNLRMDIANFNIEHAAAGSWRTDVYDIDDPENLWYGSLRYGIGTTDATFRKNGGANITTTNIGDLPAV